MQQKVQTYIQKHRLLNPNDKIIVGVSGGTDSVALLHILISLGYNCVVAHCNFHLRNEESERDEDFVRNWSTELKTEYYHIDFDTIDYAYKQGISIEMAARDLRYAWFYELLEKLDAQAIAVAHHLDDSIETMLMNLIRGTGIKGLSGIQPRNNKVVRPLLCLNRLEIERYLIRYDLDHVEDSSNSASEYLRNRFRHEVLPLLEEIQPTARQTLYTSLKNLEGNLAIYKQAIEEIENEIVHKESNSIKLDIELLKKQVHVLTVLFELLQAYGFGNVVTEQISEHLDGESGKIFYSDTHRLIKDRKYLIITEIEPILKNTFRITESDINIEKPIPLKISKIIINSDFQVSKTTDCVHIDASKLQFPLLLRHWNEGDSFYPFGMENRKKVSDFFIDNKFSLLEKEQTWLLISGEEIVWIVGHRMDNRFRVTPETKEVFEFKIVDFS